MEDDGKPRCIIRQNNYYRMYWDIWLMLLLTIVTFVTPYKMAFTDDDSIGFDISRWVIDGFFTFDIFLNFITTYTHPYDKTEITSPKLIAINYLKGWFIVDLISVLPLHLF